MSDRPLIAGRLGLCRPEQPRRARPGSKKLRSPLFLACIRYSVFRDRTVPGLLLPRPFRRRRWAAFYFRPFALSRAVRPSQPTPEHRSRRARPSVRRPAATALSIPLGGSRRRSRCVRVRSSTVRPDYEVRGRLSSLHLSRIAANQSDLDRGAEGDSLDGPSGRIRHGPQTGGSRPWPAERFLASRDACFRARIPSVVPHVFRGRRAKPRSERSFRHLGARAHRDR